MIIDPELVDIGLEFVDGKKLRIGRQFASTRPLCGRTHMRSRNIKDFADFLFQLHKGGSRSILDLNLRQDGVNLGRDTCAVGLTQIRWALGSKGTT